MTTVVYNMDCMEGMKQYPDKYFDLAIVDPPYGIGIGSTVGGGLKAKPKEYKSFDDSSVPNSDYFEELRRVSKNQVMWGGELLSRFFRGYTLHDRLG